MDVRTRVGWDTATARTHPHRLLRGPGLWLGIALGGFFDGILLHQILQWHHLLSDADWAREEGLAFQLLADGLFHALMYGVGIAGLVLLWRRRGELDEPRAGASLVGWLLVGFAAWHVSDALLSHWLLGIHRIRSDVSNPLVWDLGWLVVFGLVPMLLGALCLPRRRARRRVHGSGTLLGWATAVLTVAAAGTAAWSPSPSDVRVVVFDPNMAPAEIFEALDDLGARVVRTDAQTRVWALWSPADVTAAALYRSGALWVGGAGISGCAAWLKLPEPSTPRDSSRIEAQRS